MRPQSPRLSHVGPPRVEAKSNPQRKESVYQAAVPGGLGMCCGLVQPPYWLGPEGQALVWAGRWGWARSAYPAAREGCSRSRGSCRRSGWLFSTSCNRTCPVRSVVATPALGIPELTPPCNLCPQQRRLMTPKRPPSLGLRVLPLGLDGSWRRACGRLSRAEPRGLSYGPEHPPPAGDAVVSRGPAGTWSP